MLIQSAWEFGSVDSQPWPGPEAPDLAAVTAWRPATVPGQVHSDLLAHGMIPDPFVGANLRACAWVDALDWWYRTTLTLDLAPAQRTFITFHGLDTYAAVFVNQRCVLRSTGMFAPHTVELTGLAPPAAAIELAVRLTGPAGWPRQHHSRRERLLFALERLSGAAAALGPIPERLDHLKAPMQFGWDFAPRLRTVGIWDEVSLHSSGPATILALKPPHASAPMSGQAAGDAPVWTVEMTLDATALCAVQATLRVTPANFEGQAWAHTTALTLSPGPQTAPVILPPLTLAPWEPWERGFPHLYWLEVTLHDAATGAQLDQRRLRFGQRQVAWAPLAGPGTAPWRLHINDEPLFVRGANWVPADALPGRLRPPTYRRLLSAARAAGINLLRVWGGGLREKAAFYDLCDEMGLLVWQEFPFACLFLAAYPHETAWLDRVEAEARGIVQAVRHHPSVAMWCGGNEMGVRRNQHLLARLARAVAAEDGTRPFVPASPAQGDVHEWAVWHGRAPLRTYQALQAPFCSEFGLSALPAAESLAHFLPAAQPWPDAPVWRLHQAEAGKLAHYAALAGTPAPPADLPALIAATQTAQAAGLQVAIEHLRRHKATCGGLAFWQFNEPWPTIAWSVLDFDGRPKLAYARLQRILQPVLICLAYQLPVGARPQAISGAIWIVNDTRAPLPGLTWLAWLDNEPLAHGLAALEADASRPVGALTAPVAGRPARLRLELRQANILLASNEYDLALVDLPAQPLPSRARRWLGNRILKDEG
ncbi:MAG: glycoside hydrolase family 2 TIM barrel-domain containing protein [Anaerolineae bacterium]